MKIVELKAENIKKLVAISIKPDGNMVEITGNNGAGKTSVLDCIWWALEGAKNIQAAPIRAGAKQAKIKLDLGEIIVNRTFKQGKDGGFTTSISVESKNGAKFSSPQKMLDDLLGELTFDPLAFARMEPREQFDTLKKFVSGVDFEEIAQQNKADYDARTKINRDAKEYKSAAAQLEVDENGPTDPIDPTKLTSEMEKAANSNADIEARKVSLKQASKDMVAKREEAVGVVKEAEKRAHEIVMKAQEESGALIDAAKVRMDTLTKDADKLEASLKDADNLPAIVDITEIRKRIDQANLENTVRDQRLRKQNQLKRVERLEAESEALTKAMAAREDVKQKAIEAAKLPLPGIEFVDGGILMKGHPFNQASDAEQLRASVAIAMALNPKLKVLRVRDGSLLDENSMKLLAKLADEKDYQVWIERVDGSGKVGFVIEDGHLKQQGVTA